MRTTIGFTEFIYTLDELRELRECLRSNRNNISGALQAFDHPLAYQWIEFAQQILKDCDYPEKHFASLQGTVAIQDFIFESNKKETFSTE